MITGKYHVVSPSNRNRRCESHLFPFRLSHRIMPPTRCNLMLLKLFLFCYFCVSLSKQKLVRDLANGVSYANFLCSDNLRLNTSILQQLKAQTSSDCCEKCLTHSDCISVNYGKNGDGNGLKGTVSRYLILSNTLKIERRYSVDSSQDIMTKIPLKDYQNAKKLSTDVFAGR